MTDNKISSLAEVRDVLDKYDQIRERVLQILVKLRYEWRLDLADIHDISEVTGTEMWNIKDAYPCRVLNITYDNGDCCAGHEYIPEDWLFYAEEALDQAISKETDRRAQAKALHDQQIRIEREQRAAEKERAEYERLKQKFEGPHEDVER